MRNKRLTAAQRDELRYALEDSGMPEVLAYMAAQRADMPFNGTPDIDKYFIWDQTPEGYDFWLEVCLCHLRTRND